MKKRTILTVFLASSIVLFSATLFFTSKEKLIAHNQFTEEPSTTRSSLEDTDSLSFDRNSSVDFDSQAIRLAKDDVLPDLHSRQMQKAIEQLFEAKQKEADNSDETQTAKSKAGELEKKTDTTDNQYEWVTDQSGQTNLSANQFDTGKAGEYTGYIKKTDADQKTTTILEVPILISDESIYPIGNGVGIANWKPIFPINAQYVQQATTISEVEQQISDNLDYTLVDIYTKQPLTRQSHTVKLYTTDATASPFLINRIAINYQYVDNKNVVRTYPFAQKAYPEALLPEDDDWELLPADTQNAVITNPLNLSTIGFYGKGIPILSGYTADRFPLYWDLRDANGNHISSTPGPARALTPYVNGQFAHDPLKQGSILQHSPLDNGSSLASNFNDIMVLRKSDGKGLIGLATFQEANLYFSFELSLEANMNFRVTTNMYNGTGTYRNLAFVEAENVAYPNKLASVLALGNNAGIRSSYLQNQESVKIRYKDYRNNWFSGYRMYGWTDYNTSIENIFGPSFSIPGIESKNYEAGYVISDNMNYGALESAVPYKVSKPFEGISGSYEIFFGEEIPYMKLTSTPQTFDIYSDENDDLQTTYQLSEIPRVGDHGTIYVNYADDASQEVLTSFTADEQKQATGMFTIPRNKFPESWIPEGQSTQSYSVNMLAIDETEGENYGLPSENHAININVFHFGAKAIPQLIDQNADWTKNPKDLLEDISYISDHNITFAYANPDEPIDTSKVGLHWVDVVMTDQDKQRSSTIKVPVTVEGEETQRNDSLVLYAKDFSINKNEVDSMDTQQLHQLILTQSDAKAWYYTNGESDQITIDVLQTNLTNQPTPGETYQATIRATDPDQLTVQRVIQISVTGEEEAPVLQVPETLDFKEVSVPFSSREPNKQVKRKIPDWSIHVLDERSRPKNWTLLATLTKDFSKSDGTEELTDILTFKQTPQSVYQPLVKQQAVEIHRENAPTSGQKTLIWDENAGFLLDISLEQSLEIKKGNYQAEVTFTLADVE